MKWYQEIIVLNKEIDGSIFYCFDEENYKKISDEREEQLKEIERLKEELKELNEIMEIGRKREYHSKFLKDFQKERGKNVFPDHDEIYKRYDDYKSRVEKAIEYLEESYNETVEGIEGVAKFFSKRNETLLKILKGVDKE